jgi:filamentous hemagglutinin family protein
LGSLGAAAVWLSLGPTAAAAPQGGQVVAGSATIGASASVTTIDQSSSRAAIDWTSFDVGSGQSVVFVQPGAQAVTLNRVTGPDPSAIAGQISANGQIIITNPSGVVFSKGSQVNAQSLVVSTAGISTQNFMAGREVFDQAGQPGAQVSNQGTITVAQAGLAALVAPAVANAGVIRATLGHVVLAGVQTATLDLYGDGLVSIDVTGQVTQAPVGASGLAVTALVTNTGTIVADGGTVALTAAAADGVIQTLVNAGGTVRADTVGRQSGQVAITGTGGAVIVDGSVAAEGLGAGQRGGTVQIAGSGATTIAADAVVSASGAAGGGLVAVGTTLARGAGSGAAPAGTSAVVEVAAGARIAADATGAGGGGRVTVLSTQQTIVAGALSARGGAAGGDGGTIEMSGVLGFALSGTADASAPHGALGSIVLDPTDLTIVADGQTSNITPCGGCDPNIGYGDTPAEATVTAAQIEALTGNIRLQAVNDLTVASDVSLGAQNLTLEAGNDLTVAAGVTVAAGGIITLSAAAADIPGFNPAGALSIAGTVSSLGAGVVLNAGSGGIAIAGGVNDAGGSLMLETSGPAAETGGGVVSAGSLAGAAASLTFATAGNAIGTLAGFVTTAGGLTVDDARYLSVTGTVAAEGGAGAIGMSAAGLYLDAAIAGGLVSLNGGAGRIFQQYGAITAGTLSGAGAFIGLSGGNAIGALGGVSALSGVLLFDTQPLLVRGAVTGGAGQTELIAPDITVQGGVSGGSVVLETGDDLTVAAGATVTATGPISLVAADPILPGYGAGGALRLLGGVSLSGGCAPCQVLLGAATGGITLGGTVEAPAGGVSIATSGVLSQPGGVLSAGTLYGHAGMVTLGAVNAVGTLGPFSSVTGFTLNNAGALTVAGVLSDGVGVALTTGGALTLAGTIGAPSLAVAAGGGIAQTGGYLNVGTLSGSAGGAAWFGALNTVSVLGAFSSVGGFTLADAGALTVTGAIDAGGGSVALAAAGMVLAADMTGLGVSLASAGYIEQTAGAITAGTLSVDATSVMLGGANMIGVLGDISSYGGVFVNDAMALLVQGTVAALGMSGGVTIAAAGDLMVAGSVGAPQVLLQAAGITLAGVVDASGPGVDVQTAGALDEQGGGAIRAGYLEGSAGSVWLVSAGNRIAAIGPGGFAVQAGNFALADGAALAVGSAGSGAVIDVPAGGTIALTADSLVVQPAGGGPSLQAPGGSIVIDPLTPGTPVELGAGTLGGAGTLSITGGALGAMSAAVLQIGQASGGVGDAGAIVVGPDGSAVDLGADGFGTLLIESQGAVTQGGVLTVPVLGGQAARLGLTDSGNGVTTLAGFVSTSGDVSLSGAGAVQVTGALTADGGAGEIVLSAQDGIDLAASVSGADVRLNGGAGDIVQTAGVIAAGTLSGATLGAATLSGTGANAIGVLGDFTAGSGFLLTVAPSLLVQGAVSAGTVTIGSMGGLTVAGSIAGGGGIDLTGGAGGVSIGGGVNAGDAALVVETGGALSEAGGTIVAGDLDGAAASVSLLSAGNRIGGVGALAGAGGFDVTGGNFTLVDGWGLTVGRAGSDAGVGVPVNGTIGLTTDRLTVAAPYGGARLAAPDGTIVLQPLTAGAPIALGGDSVGAAGTLSITAAALAGMSAATLQLGQPGNLAGGPIAIAPGGGVADLAASGIVALVLESTGAVTQEGGLAVALLSGQAGSIGLDSAANAIGTLAGFVSGGAFLLADAAPLTVAGTVSLPAGGMLTLADTATSFAAGSGLVAPGGTVWLQAGTPGAPLTLSGTLALARADTLLVGGGEAGPITLGGRFDLGGVGVLDLESGGAVTETAGGVLQVGSLEGSAGSLSLPGANMIVALGGFAAAGAFDLNDGEGLAQSGVLSAATVGVTVAGGLALNGMVNAGAGLTIDATGAVVETGAVSAASLSGAAGSVALGGANAIGALAGFTSGAGFLLNDGQVLRVDGPVSAGVLTLQGVGATLAANVTATGLDLAVAGAVNQTGGVVCLGTLSGSAGAVALGTAGALTLASLGDLAAGGTIGLNDGAALRIEGDVSAPSVALSAVGALTLEAGTLRTADGVLQVLPGAGGAGAFSQTGSSLVQPLTGAAAALRIAVPAGGSITLDDLQAPAMAVVLSLGAGRASGMLSAGGLAVDGSGGSANLTGAVGGLSGAAAAGAATITPAASTAYLLNDCEIEAAVCGAPVVPDSVLQALAPALLRPDVAAAQMEADAAAVLAAGVMELDPLLVGGMEGSGGIGAKGKERR